MSERKVQLSGRLPGSDGNGLEPWFDELGRRESDLQVVAVAVIEQDSWKVKKATGEESAIAKIVHIEVADGQDRKELLALLDRLRSERTGDEPLDLPVEQEPMDFESPLVDEASEELAQLATVTPVEGWDGGDAA